MDKWFNEAKALELENTLLRKRVNDAEKLLAEKNETANTFMNQVKKLQARLQEAERLLSESQEHFQYGLEFGVTTDPRSWMQRRDAFLNPKPNPTCNK